MTLTMIVLLALVILLLLGHKAQAIPTKKSPDYVIENTNLQNAILIVADLNNDSLPDIFSMSGDFGTEDRPRFRITYQNPNGSFPGIANKTVKYSSWTFMYSACIGDLNSDGLNDLAVKAGNSLYIHYQNAARNRIPTNANLSWDIPLWKLFCADLNGDSRTDLAYYNASGLVIHYQRVNGSLNREPDKVLPISICNSCDLLDFNGDGRMDIVTSRENISIHYQRADYNYSLEPDLFWKGMGSGGSGVERRIGYGHLNRDGLMDLIVFDVPKKYLYLYYQQKNGTFLNTLERSWYIDERPGRISIGDLNNDGWNDIAFNLYQFHDGLVVLQRDENGDWPTGLGYTLDTIYGTNTIITDLNQDGLLDLVADSHSDIHIFYQEFSINSLPKVILNRPHEGEVFKNIKFINFNGIGTEDPDSSNLEFWWHSSIDGWFLKGLNNNTQLTPGKHVITLWVNDILHNISSVPINITILPPNRDPLVVIDSPDLSHDIYPGIHTFDASGSYDPDGDELRYFWLDSAVGSLSWNSTFEMSLAEGEYNITLWVSDGNGTNRSIVLIITVIQMPNFPPEPIINNPVEGVSYYVNSMITFDAQSTRDSNFDELKYYWVSEQDGFLGDRVKFTKGLSLGKHQLTLWVNDGQGENRSVQLNLTVTGDYPDWNLVFYEPLSNAILNGNVTIRGTAAPHVKTVQLILPNLTLGRWISLKASPDWSFEWQTQSLPNNLYDIKIRGLDAYSSYSQEVHLRVYVDNTRGEAHLGDRYWILDKPLILSLVLILVGVVILASLVYRRLNGDAVIPKVPTTTTPPDPNYPLTTTPPARSQRHPPGSTNINPARQSQTPAPGSPTKEPPTPVRSKPRLVTIECPNCSNRMRLERLGVMQPVKCISCGLEGNIEV